MNVGLYGGPKGQIRGTSASLIGARLRMTNTNQGFPAGDTKVLEWDVLDYDSGGFTVKEATVTAGTHWYRTFQIQQSGLHLISVGYHFQPANANGGRFIGVFKNGIGLTNPTGSIYLTLAGAEGGNEDHPLSCSCVDWLEAGEYVRAAGFMFASGFVPTGVATNNYFAIQYLGR
jgi:hypothetical protein